MSALWNWLISLFKKPADPKTSIAVPVENPVIPHDDVPVVKEPSSNDVGPGERTKTIDKLALDTTGSFEGKGFTEVSGDFDGQGVSAGILQWCYGQGSLQEQILKPWVAKHGPIDALRIFPKSVDVTASMNGNQACQYARANMLDINRKGHPMLPAWQRAWETFMGRADVIEIQLASSHGKLLAAYKLAEQWGYPNSPRAICFFFDIITQNGSMKGISKPSANRSLALSYAGAGSANRTKWGQMIATADDESLCLFQAAYLRAKMSNPQWFSDVFSRKGTIALGAGTVHGKFLDLNKQYAAVPKL